MDTSTMKPNIAEVTQNNSISGDTISKEKQINTSERSQVCMNKNTSVLGHSVVLINILFFLAEKLYNNGIKMRHTLNSVHS